MHQITRSRFLKLLSLGGASFLGLGPVVAAALEQRGGLVQWARLKFTCRGEEKDDWNAHPHGDLNLIDHLKDHTTVGLEKKWNVAEISKLEAMTRYPFLFMHAELPVEMDETDRKNLREYLLRGGFLFAEDCVLGKMKAGNNKLNDHFFLSMIEELPRVLPEAKLEKLPNDHPIFHSFYHLPNGLPHMQGTPHGLWGLTLNNRLIAAVSPSDNHCGWTNGSNWFGEAQRQLALQIGANIYVYAMTQDA